MRWGEDDEEVVGYRSLIERGARGTDGHERGMDVNEGKQDLWVCSVGFRRIGENIAAVHAEDVLKAH